MNEITCSLITTCRYEFKMKRVWKQLKRVSMSNVGSKFILSGFEEVTDAWVDTISSLGNSTPFFMKRT